MRRGLRPLPRSLKHSRVVIPHPFRLCSHAAPSSAATASIPPTTSHPSKPAADHRLLATEQGLFTTDPAAPGSPLLLPNGARVFGRLVDFLRAQYRLFGFEEVVTPIIYKQSLWEQSGHWDNYKDDMYEVSPRGATARTGGREVSEDEVFGLKPMNCPGHCLLFKAQKRGYTQLPIRYADFGPLHRNEVSGALSGLTRVRKFHQDDGHIFCRPSQISSEIGSTLDFVAMVYKTFKLPSFKLVLSTRPTDHYIGTVQDWDGAEDALKVALDSSGRQWTIAEGDGAFYGPKIDIILKDSDGKEHQTATVQLDFQLPQRFDLQYRAPAPELEQKGLQTTDPQLLEHSGPVTPVIIHRAILGSLERFMALLIEHYNGRWPFWLSPRQAIVLTAGYNHSTELKAYISSTLETITGVRVVRDAEDGTMNPAQPNAQAFNVDVDDSDRSLGKKVREAKHMGYNIIVVVGEKGMKKGMVDIDITGQRDVVASSAVLQDVLAGEVTGDLRAVGLAPEQVFRLFSKLAMSFE
ncbi:MAG: hypothetical protein M1833_003686 [Piccolia ochrophora]|nr:MAG: hypothetical protein M1833_003686 [Piccolia ochrophora]